MSAQPVDNIETEDPAILEAFARSELMWTSDLERDPILHIIHGGRAEDKKLIDDALAEQHAQLDKLLDDDGASDRDKTVTPNTAYSATVILHDRVNLYDAMRKTLKQTAG